jgi:hypothetical protein
VVAALTLLCTAGCSAISFLLGYAILGEIPAAIKPRCTEPGVCGTNGAILALLKDPEGEYQLIVELLPLDPDLYSTFVHTPSTSLNGMAFAERSDGVVLYVGADDGVRTYDGAEYDTLLNRVAIDACGRVFDVFPVSDGDLLLACADPERIVRVRATDGRADAEFSCCEGIADGALLRTIGVDPAGLIYTGTHAVYVFDLTTGAFVRVLLTANDAGAASFEDILWSPEGLLYVAAPERGVLIVDPESGDVLDVLRPIELGAAWSPSALALDSNGFLLVGSSGGGSIVRLNAHSGELIEITLEVPARDVASLAVRP